MLIHEKNILITAAFLDSNNHVNNVQYAHWVEMMAAEHWDLLKHKSAFENDYWIMLDHHLSYKQQVYLGETILVRTYPQKPEGIKQLRMVEFYKDGKLAVVSRTLWALIDHKTLRIKRLDENWLDDLA